MTAITLSPEEISRRIRIAMQQAHGLFEELNDLFRNISMQLRESDADITPLGGKGFMLPKDKQNSKSADRFVKRDIGFIAEIGAVEPEEADDELDDADDVEDDGDDEAAGKRTVEIVPGKQFLGIRAILLDTKDANLEPVLVAGLFGNLMLVPRAKGNKQPTAQPAFNLRRNVLKRLAKGLVGSDQTNRRAVHKITQGELTATVLKWHSRPLSGFSSAEDVNAFVKQVVQMVKTEP